MIRYRQGDGKMVPTTVALIGCSIFFAIGYIIARSYYKNTEKSVIREDDNEDRVCLFKGEYCALYSYRNKSK